MRYSEQSAPPYISIHALLAESDLNNIGGQQSSQEFLSTLSLRRATWRAAFQRLRDSYFYPRSPCGERQLGSYSSVAHNIFLSTLSLRRATLRRAASTRTPCISIHALLAESDAPNHNRDQQNRNFYPRSPCGERRKAPRTGAERKTISIHALLAESDVMQGKPQQTAPGISIHALLAESDYFCPP